MLLFLFHFRYESSGYDEASFRKVYHSSPYPKKFSTPKQSFQSHHQSHITQEIGNQSQQTTSSQQQQQNTIESGPSFNESLERFRIATSSGGESDGGGDPQNQQFQSVFRQSRSSATSSTQKTNFQSRTSEEQRTIITRNSQKSYHIEWINNFSGNLISWFIWLSIFFKVSYWKCLYYAICKKKTKMSTLRYLLQKLKNKAGHSKKRYYYCGIIDHDVIIQVPWLSKNKIVIPLLPIPAHHISCEDFFGQSNFFLCRISQFSQEITLRQIINSLLSPLTNRYCCKVKRKMGL